MSSTPGEGLAVCRTKTVPLFLRYSKTLSIGPVPGIKVTISRPTVERGSIDRASHVKFIKSPSIVVDKAPVTPVLCGFN